MGPIPMPEEGVNSIGNSGKIASQSAGNLISSFIDSSSIAAVDIGIRAEHVLQELRKRCISSLAGLDSWAEVHFNYTRVLVGNSMVSSHPLNSEALASCECPHRT